MINLVRLILFILFFAFAPANAKSSKRVLTLEWEDIPGVSKYEIEVFKIKHEEEPKKIKSFFKTKPKWKARLKPGVYKFRLRAYDDRGVPGEWGDFNDLNIPYPSVVKLSPKKDVVINPESDGKTPVEFKWIPLQGIDDYELKIYNLSQKKLIKKTVQGKSFSVPLLIGQKYSWNITTKEKKEEKIPEKSPFTISGTVLPKVIILEKKSMADKKNLYWKSAPQAQYSHIEISAYRLDLLDKNFPYKEEKVKTLKKQKLQSLNLIDHLIGGMYKISISNSADLWTSSESSDVYFRIKNGEITKMSKNIEEIVY